MIKCALDPRNDETNDPASIQSAIWSDVGSEYDDRNQISCDTIKSTDTEDDAGRVKCGIVCDL